MALPKATLVSWAKPAVTAARPRTSMVRNFFTMSSKKQEISLPYGKIPTISPPATNADNRSFSMKRGENAEFSTTFPSFARPGGNFLDTRLFLDRPPAWGYIDGTDVPREGTP